DDVQLRATALCALRHARRPATIATAAAGWAAACASMGATTGCRRGYDRSGRHSRERHGRGAMLRRRKIIEVAQIGLGLRGVELRLQDRFSDEVLVFRLNLDNLGD